MKNGDPICHLKSHIHVKINDESGVTGVKLIFWGEP
jgi:hypothetical protein